MRIPGTSRALASRHLCCLTANETVLLVAMLLKRVAEEGTLLNYSSGAGDFKRRRGGEGCLEFNALYTGHLPFSRRLTFSLLGRCLSASVPQLLSSIAV